MHLKRNAPRNHAIHAAPVRGRIAGDLDWQHLTAALGNHDIDSPGVWTFVGPDGAACWIADDGDCSWTDARRVPGSGEALARHIVEKIAGGSLASA